jgi:hypothetical protein
MRVTCDFGLWRGEKRRRHGTLGRRRGEDRRRVSPSGCKRAVIGSSLRWEILVAGSSLWQTLLLGIYQVLNPPTYSLLIICVNSLTREITSIMEA